MTKTKVARLTQFLSWPFVFLFFNSFLTLKINGRENLKRVTSPFLIISNHISPYDSFAFRLVLGFLNKKLPLRFMAVNKFSEENKLLNFLSSLKIIDLVYATFGVFVIEVGRGLDNNLEEAKRILEKGGNIVMYPEGRIVRDGSIKEFKNGASVLAQRTGVTVVPIAMKIGSRKFWRREFVVNIGEIIYVDNNIPTQQVTQMFFERINKLYNQN